MPPRKRATIPIEAVAVAFSADGKKMACRSMHTNLGTVWDVTTGEPKKVHELKLPEGIGTNSHGFSTDSKTLAAACSDGIVRFWDIGGAKAKEMLALPKLDKQTIAWVGNVKPTGKLFALIVADGKVTIWDIDGTERKKREPFPVALIRVSGASCSWMTARP